MKRLKNSTQIILFVFGQDFFSLLVYVSGNPVGTPLAWSYLRANWPYLVDRLVLIDLSLQVYVYGNLVGTPLAWSYLLANWPYLVDRLVLIYLSLRVYVGSPVRTLWHGPTFALTGPTFWTGWF